MVSAIIGVIAALTGCSLPIAIEAEKAAVEQPWTDCVARAINRLDDGKFDPVRIAYGIEPSWAVLYGMDFHRDLTDATASVRRIGWR